MKTISRPTPDQLFAAIEELTKQDSRSTAEPDSPDYWSVAAERADRKCALWRQIGDTCGAETPEWARYSAYRTGDHYADLAGQYRQFARETDALRKQADAP